MPHVFHRGSSNLDNARALKLSLEYLIALNLIFLDAQARLGHPVTNLYRSGVVYGRTLVWDTIPALYMRTYGDCKSLTAALIAQYRKAGIACNPVFRFRKNQRNGENDFHILVQRGGTFEDPSKALGMGQDELRYFY
jgi:hypothetical protein